MTELILIRHAQSTVNAGLSEDVDCCLTELGHAQATALAEFLSKQDLTGFSGIVSPYQRTQQTADVIASATGLEFSRDYRIREWGATCRIDGVLCPSESAEELATRLAEFQRWAERRQLVVVTHGACVDVLKHYAIGSALPDQVFGTGIENACCLHIQDGRLTDLTAGY